MIRSRLLIPLQLIVAFVAGWLQREQHEVIEYLRKENRILRAQLRGRRLRLTDDERRRLAVLGDGLGRRFLMHVAAIVTPDTILRWHRQLIARKWTRQRLRRPRHEQLGHFPFVGVVVTFGSRFQK